MTDSLNQRVRITARRTLSQNRFKLEVVTFDQQTPDGGSETLEREIYHNGTGVAVLPIDRERNTVLLVRQLRIPALLNGDGDTLIEACAGMVENDADPAAAIAREAEEELGFRLRNVARRFDLYTSPGACTEKLVLYVADYSLDDRIGAGGGLAGEGEQIEILELALPRAWEMVETGGIADAKTVLLIQQARLDRLADR